MKNYIIHLIEKLHHFLFLFKKYGRNLGRVQPTEMPASFSGDAKKFPVYLKRRKRGKNLKARSLKLRK